MTFGSGGSLVETAVNPNVCSLGETSFSPATAAQLLFAGSCAKHFLGHPAKLSGLVAGVAVCCRSASGADTGLLQSLLPRSQIHQALREQLPGYGEVRP